ncbi:MAG: hypothetical protein UU24_C0001G0021 [Candidatus Nomurabacteria bacterium GW2011_GWA2_40_9]|uniref:Uncharacterized protein n=1 Tax=Candidatus Nomurabacteria bacterium GW2011_GWA2_40_9 TaxID=1618734 RepID=A0A0G0WWS9_9BACT|nr:MAG: hypothetical protein UU24_C0001G0021 [Candidatus Nomurabacteria bacterium GW2011_GWA2_40_9]
MNKKVDTISNNFSKIVDSFKDKWVAVPLDYSEVVASADTLNGVTSKIKKNSNLKIFKVIPFDMIYSPFNL